MDSTNNKVKCPHCNDFIDIDKIYLHVKEMFGDYLYDCSQCGVRTNDYFYATYHENKSGHKVNLKTQSIPGLETLINGAATALIDFSLDKTSNNSTDSNKTTENTKQPSPVIPFIKQSSPVPPLIKGLSPILPSIKELSPILPSIKELSPEWVTGGDDNSSAVTLNKLLYKISLKTINFKNIVYKSKYLPSKPTLSIFVPKKKENGKKKINIKLPRFIVDEIAWCLKCHKKVGGNYLDRRNHVTGFHADEVKNYLNSITELNEPHMLIAIFKTINACFPNYPVCSDFQCLVCGKFCLSNSEKILHLGTSHQDDYILECPFQNCDFKTGLGYSMVRHYYNYHENERQQPSQELSISQECSFAKELNISEQSNFSEESKISEDSNFSEESNISEESNFSEESSTYKESNISPSQSSTQEQFNFQKPLFNQCGAANNIVRQMIIYYFPMNGNDCDIDEELKNDLIQFSSTLIQPPKTYVGNVDNQQFSEEQEAEILRDIEKDFRNDFDRNTLQKGSASRKRRRISDED